MLLIIHKTKVLVAVFFVISLTIGYRISYQNVCVCVYIHMRVHKICSESNAFYFIMVADSVRGGCWWCGRRG